MGFGQVPHTHNRTLAAGASQHDLGNQNRDADGEDRQCVDQYKSTATVFTGEVGEAPQIAQADGGANRGEKKSAFMRPDVMTAHG